MTRNRGRFASVLVAVVVLALAAVAVWQGKALRDDHQENQDRSAAIRVAEAQVVDLTTLDSATVKDKIAAMAQRTSGSFREELTGITDAFVAAVSKSKIAAQGQIDSAAIVSFSDTDAEVIVASTAQVSSGSAAEPVTRTYRMKVTLERTGKTWLIDGMEFVA